LVLISGNSKENRLREKSKMFVGRGFTGCGKKQLAVIPMRVFRRGIPFFQGFQPLKGLELLFPRPVQPA